MKKPRLFALVLALTLSVLTLSGCAQPSEETPASQGEESSAVQQESEPSSQGQSAGFTHTAYPPQDAFTLQVTLQNDTVPRGEPFVLECSLQNTSGEDYYIVHGGEVFSYAYNGSEESILAMGVPEYFHQGDQLTRTMEIPSTTSGTITVRADFDVFLTPDPEGASQPYTYSQEFEVTVE